MEPIDLNATRKELSDMLEGFNVDGEDLNGYLMYPKVFLDYMGRHRTYGPVRTLPTKTFFYGMAPAEQISVEIDPGKTLEIRLQAIGETDENGEARVFFELNGQPRTIRVTNRKVAANATKRPKAQAGVNTQIGAPMPGVISSVAVVAGQKVKSGVMLLTIEAMKMENILRAEKKGVVSKINAGAGDSLAVDTVIMEFE